jgi:hypothetical protein
MEGIETEYLGEVFCIELGLFLPPSWCGCPFEIEILEDRVKCDGNICRKCYADRNLEDFDDEWELGWVICPNPPPKVAQKLTLDLDIAGRTIVGCKIPIFSEPPSWCPYIEYQIMMRKEVPNEERL